MYKSALLFLMPVLICSCYSYHIRSRNIKECPGNIERKNVYIVNPEYSGEYSILSASGIYNIVSDSTAAGVTKIKLLPPGRTVVCGNPLIGWAMFLGQIPIYLPSGRSFRFIEYTGGQEITKEFALPVYCRYWFWDVFSKRKDFNHVAGKALKLSLCSQ
jgi:hypothetical protein